MGDRYVVEQMRQNGYNLGGEQSGHMIFLDHGTTGDGILSALQVIAVMLREGRPLSELKKVMEHYPQKAGERSHRCKEIHGPGPGYSQTPVRHWNKDWEKRARMVIRPSGTEPVIRVMVEGANREVIEEVAYAMASCIQKHMK